MILKQTKRKMTLILIAYLCFVPVILAIFTATSLYHNRAFKYTTVYKVFPVIIMKYNHPTEPNVGGFSTGPVIALSEGLWENNSVLRHELTHAKQYYRYLLASSFFIHFNKDYLIKFEYEAYKAEDPLLTDGAIASILMSSCYKHNKNRQEVLEVISSIKNYD